MHEAWWTDSPGCAQAIKFLATIPMKREGGYFCCAVSLHAFQFLSLSEAKGFERCADPPHPLFLMDFEPKMPLWPPPASLPSYGCC